MPSVLRLPFKAVRILVHRLTSQGVVTTLKWATGRGFLKLTGIPLVRFTRITPEVWVGGQYGPRGKRKLLRHGVNAGVNMRIEFDDAAHDLAFEHYCHLPTVDETAPTLDHLQEGVEFMQRVIEARGSVYVHCAGGVGRAPSMAAAYFMSQGMTLDEAVTLIQQVRPYVDLLPPQVSRLQEFEALQRDGHNG